MFSISGIVHFRSNAFDSTILKIWNSQYNGGLVSSTVHTFWTLMLWLVLLKIRLAFIALANRLACIVSVMM